MPEMPMDYIYYDLFQVMPAALRAQRRLRYDIDRREQELHKQVSSQELRFRAERERHRRDTSVWESEYRRCFVGYNDNDYRLATPDRMIVPRGDIDLMASIIMP